VIVELKDEIKRSLDYFRGRPTGGEIDEILLCGGSSKLKNLDKYFEREFNIPTHIASPLAYVRPTAKNFSMEYLEDVAPQFAVAIGLAARDMIIPPSMPSPLVSGKRGKKK
jgi:type IV pilus assembly protein PilM